MPPTVNQLTLGGNDVTNKNTFITLKLKFIYIYLKYLYRLFHIEGQCVVSINKVHSIDMTERSFWLSSDLHVCVHCPCEHLPKVHVACVRVRVCVCVLAYVRARVRVCASMRNAYMSA